MTRLYRLPPIPGNVGGVSFRALLLASLTFIALNWAGTQYIAHGFGYDPRLSPALVLHVYKPWMWVIWAVKSIWWNHDAQWLVFRGICIAMSSTIITPLVFVVAGRRKQNVKESADLHGSAKWADKSDVNRTGLLTAKQGVYVGGWQDGGTLRYLIHNGPDHVLAFAPTRSGKGVSLVLPTLLGGWYESAVIYDIKGENWAKTAGYRATLGPVFKFSPTEPDSSSRFNPLAEIRIGTSNEVRDAQNIAKMIVYDGEQSFEHEPYWKQTAESLLLGCFLHCCYKMAKTGRVACLKDVSDLLHPVGKPFGRALVKVGVNKKGQDIMAMTDGVLGEMLRYPHNPDSTTHPTVAAKAQEMLDKEDKNFDGVLSNTRTALQLYADPVIASNTSASDFRIADLVSFDRPVSLYLIVPASDKVRLRQLIRLMFTLIINRLTEKMDFQDGAYVPNKQRLLLLLDEFPSLKRMEIFADALSYMAGFGIKAYLIAQDIRQIQSPEAYGQKESITSNCNVWTAFPPNTQETAMLLSDMLGKQTVQQEQLSYGGGRFSPVLGHVTANLRQESRALLLANEVRKLRAPKKEGEGSNEKITAPGQMLVWVNGHEPILGTQMLYFLDPIFSARASLPTPPDLTAIEDGKEVLQRPLNRTPHVLSRVEVAPEQPDEPEEEQEFQCPV